VDAPDAPRQAGNTHYDVSTRPNPTDKMVIMINTGKGSGLVTRFRNYTLIAAGILVLATAISWTNLGRAMASDAQAAVQKVTFTNKSIQVTGSVNAAPYAPTDPVQFAAAVAAKGPAGEETQSAYTVPSGKQLVIEFVSASYEQQSSDEFAHTSFSIGSGPKYFIPLSNITGRGEGYDFLNTGAQEVRVYAKAGDVVTARVQHQTLLEPGSATFSFSGYLVNS